MGFFGDLGKAILGTVTGDNSYAEEVASKFHPYDYYGIIRCVEAGAEATYNLKYNNDASGYAKMTGYWKGLRTCVAKHLKELSGYDRNRYKDDIEKAISYCEKNSSKFEIYHNFANALRQALNEGTIY